MAKGTPVGGNSSVLPVMGEEMERKEVTDQAHTVFWREKRISNVTHGEEGHEFGPDGLVLIGGRDLVSQENPNRGAGIARRAETMTHSLHA